MRTMRVVGILLALLAVSVGCASAQSQIGLRALEGRVGLVDPEDAIDMTFGLSAAADLGTLTPDIGLEVGIDFWTKSNDPFSWTNVAFLGTGRYMFETGSTFHPFAFAGLGFHIVSFSVDDTYNLFADEDTSELEFGFHLGAGAETPISDNMNLTGRLGYNVNGGIDYLFIQAGLKFLLGQ